MRTSFGTALFQCRRCKSPIRFWYETRCPNCKRRKQLTDATRSKRGGYPGSAPKARQKAPLSFGANVDQPPAAHEQAA
jgi:hypothetical protein